jgi:hypothetical protein
MASVVEMRDSELPLDPWIMMRLSTLFNTIADYVPVRLCSSDGSLPYRRTIILIASSFSSPRDAKYSTRPTTGRATFPRNPFYASVTRTFPAPR